MTCWGSERLSWDRASVKVGRETLYPLEERVAFEGEVT